MIVKDALRSLLNSFSKTVFYWLTFVLTSMFIFLFFNISMSDTVGVHWINNDNGVATTVTVFVITVCMVILFFANDFFVRTKSRDLAVRLVCGATYMQLAGYLLVQTFLILLTAIPLGVIAAVMMIPVMNSAVSYLLNEPFVIAIHGSATGVTVLILVSEVFWTTYLNLAFAYRNSASSMLNETRMRNPLSGVVFYKDKKVKQRTKLKKFFSGFLFVAPLICFFLTDQLTVCFAGAGMLGLLMSIKNLLIPFINHEIENRKISDPEAVAFLGFLRTDIVIMKNNIILFIVSSILLIAIVMTPDLTSAETMLALLSYIVMNVLLALALMFKFSTELSIRRKSFLSLDQIGYLKKEQKQIIFLEVSSFYGFVLMVSLLYLECMMISRVNSGWLQGSLVLPFTAFLVIPLLVCYVITLYYYRSAVFSAKRKRIREQAD